MSIKKELQLIDQLENLVDAAEKELEIWGNSGGYDVDGSIYSSVKNTLFEKIQPYFWERVRKLNIWVEEYIRRLEELPPEEGMKRLLDEYHESKPAWLVNVLEEFEEEDDD
jgi:hypothetical protein